ncbi:endosialin [Corchorus capsularis]|uniref:Endosialin n=1 Tax=Corchorus capsularis TaxID=210143 RepID=A0A1R3GI15_COCAP|nr:endosialin [Corchorus capsularis]
MGLKGEKKIRHLLNHSKKVSKNYGSVAISSARVADKAANRRALLTVLDKPPLPSIPPPTSPDSPKPAKPSQTPTLGSPLPHQQNPSSNLIKLNLEPIEAHQNRIHRPSSPDGSAAKKALIPTYKNPRYPPSNP